jgi:hypothetical protein
VVSNNEFFEIIPAITTIRDSGSMHKQEKTLKGRKNIFPEPEQGGEEKGKEGIVFTAKTQD